MAYRNYSVANGFTVAQDGSGDFTTIAAALTAASSGMDIFIRPGTYTENLTLKAGVNLVAFTGDDATPNVTIIGKLTYTVAGTCTVSNMRLQTNSDFFLVVSGSVASIINLQNCYLNCSNNTGISFTSSSASSSILIDKCIGLIGTTGITYFVSTAAGQLVVRYSNLPNGSATSTSSSSSTGSVLIEFSTIAVPLLISGTSVFVLKHTNLEIVNNTAITTTGTGGATLRLCRVGSGTASAFSIGAGSSISCYGTSIGSTNANAVAGTGNFNYSGITFDAASSTLQNTLGLALLGSTPSNAASGYVLTSTGPNTSPTWQSNLVNTLRPAFSAYLSTSATNVTGNGTIYTIIYNNTDVNNTASFSTGTGLFTAPITGNYLFSYAIYLTTTSTWNNSFNSYLIINGTNSYKTVFAYGTPNTSNQIVYTALVPLTAGQTVGVGISAFTVANTLNTTVVGVASPLRSNIFSGYLVS